MTKFFSFLFKKKSVVPRSDIYCVESETKKHEYLIDVLTSGRRYQFTVVRSVASNNRELNIVDSTNQVCMKIMMDLEKEQFSVVDCRAERYYQFSKGRYCFVFSEIQAGEEIPLAKVIPRQFSTKADVIWIRRNDDFGKKVAQLSRPLFSKFKYKYGVDVATAWFGGHMDRDVAVVLQLCFMCIRRYINRTQL